MAQLPPLPSDTPVTNAWIADDGGGLAIGSSAAMFARSMSIWFTTWSGTSPAADAACSSSTRKFLRWMSSSLRACWRSSSVAIARALALLNPVDAPLQVHHARQHLIVHPQHRAAKAVQDL